MSEQKRYTADELREAAGQVVSELYTNPFADMLRQAADAEDELKLALVTIGNQSDEIAQLKARLEAVVKELEDMRKWCAFACVDQEDVDEILQVARGEGGAK